MNSCPYYYELLPLPTLVKQCHSLTAINSFLVFGFRILEKPQKYIIFFNGLIQYILEIVFSQKQVILWYISQEYMEYMQYTRINLNDKYIK